jgi:hypothetical protein
VLSATKLPVRSNGVHTKTRGQTSAGNDEIDAVVSSAYGVTGGGHGPPRLRKATLLGLLQAKDMLPLKLNDKDLKY